MKKTILLFASAALILTACNNSTTEQPAEGANTEAAATEEVSPEASITITGDDAMKFDLTEIKVKEGQTVKLKLVHSGTQPVTAMGHNFVLLASGVDMDAFAQDAMKAKDNGYIPAGHEKDIIAHTKTIGGGESDEISFPAPAKGTYDFLCTFPGHYAMMKGKFIVE